MVANPANVSMFDSMLKILRPKKNVFFVNYCYTKLTLIGHHGIVWNFNPVDVILLSNF